MWITVVPEDWKFVDMASLSSKNSELLKFLWTNIVLNSHGWEEMEDYPHFLCNIQFLFDLYLHVINHQESGIAVLVAVFEY